MKSTRLKVLVPALALALLSGVSGAQPAKRSHEERVSRLPHTYQIAAGAGAIMDALKVFVPLAKK